MPFIGGRPLTHIELQGRHAAMTGQSVNSPFHKEVAGRFGLVPNFFMSAQDAPEIVEKLWDFAKAAYLDNAIPSVFKERLFVFLSRFCPVRYCIIRHCGFLVGYGNSSGDPSAHPQTIEQVISLREHPRLGDERSNQFIRVWRQSTNQPTGPLLKAISRIGYSRLRP